MVQQITLDGIARHIVDGAIMNLRIGSSRTTRRMRTENGVIVETLAAFQQRLQAELGARPSATPRDHQSKPSELSGPLLCGRCR